MTVPFDPVQLRALAEAATPGPWIRSESRPWVVTAEARNGFDLAYCGPKPPDPSPLRAEHDAAFIAACDPQTVLTLLDLLAGQAEQIERLKRERDEWSEAAGRNRRAWDVAVRQRDNLRDAAEDYLHFKDPTKLIAALDALRADAVGEDTEPERRKKSQDEWEREYDDAVQWRDHLTCEQLLVEREGLSWWPVGEETQQ